MKERILISTGGSGGHVVPATILYEHLKDEFDVSMSTDYRGMKFLDKNKYNLKILNLAPISRNVFLLPYQLMLVSYLIIKSIFFFKKKKNRYINFNGWLHVSTFVSSFKNFED